jgi:hypothetical protein
MEKDKNDGQERGLDLSIVGFLELKEGMKEAEPPNGIVNRWYSG